MFSRRAAVAIVVLSGFLVCSADAAAAENGPRSPEQMAAEIDALRAEVAELRREKQGDWLDARRAEQVKQLVREVLADADTRASLMVDSITAGRDKTGFFIASSDGAFVLRIGGQVQFRYIANFRQDAQGAPTAVDDAAEAGFTIRRAKLSFSGNIGHPKLIYYFLLAGNRDTTAVELEQAYLGYQFTERLRLVGGRFMNQFAREQYVISGRQLTAERSLVNLIFAGNDFYVEGVLAQYTAEAFRVAASVNDGLNSGTAGGTATGFLNGGNDFANDAADIALTGRLDVKLTGDWAQFLDFQSWPGDKPGVMVGAGVHYEIAETGDAQASGTTPVTGPYDSFVTGAFDASLEAGGLTLYGGLFGQRIFVTDANTLGDMENFGAVAQVGYMLVPERLEPFARYEWVSIDDAVATDELHLVTLGFNYFLSKHAAKFTLDAVWAMQPLTTANTRGVVGAAGTGISSLGLLGDGPGDDDQVSLRAQFQVLF